MRSELRTAIAILATTLVLLGSATMALAADADPVDPVPSATAPAPGPIPSEPTPTASTPTPAPTTDVPTDTFEVTDAQIRWGVNDESNNRAFAPGTFNFLSAGRIPDPGRGGVLVPQSSWSQRSGNVSIEKYLDGRWTPATWAGLRTTSTGAAMTGTAGPFSNHEVVISGGTGTVDPARGAATIRWTGSFTVLYYSGYSFFYVTDPQLTVVDGIGRLTATLSGFGSSMDDLSTWSPVPARPGVVLAELGRVDLSQDLGFTATPAYRGVAVSLPVGASPQARTGDAWGSFPQSFVDYQTSSGTGSYWYSSGGSADAHKVARPVTVSYSAGSPVAVVPPATGRTTPTKKVENRTRARPAASPSPAPAPVSAVSGPAASSAPAGAAAPGQALAASSSVRPAATVTGAAASPATSPDATGLWLLGGLLSAGALLVAAAPLAYGAVRRSPRRPLVEPPVTTP